ncbi:MAG: amidohydrolase family protein [Anaerolineaceae bacterium]|nr:amidohydrolase family protein [Anaerolineaceae bacterium]
MFTNVNIVPMTSDQVVYHQNVLIEDDEIIAIGDQDRLRVPNHTKVINGEGLYLLPGLADMHMHTRLDWEEPQIWPVHPLSLYLANGVTTVRDFSPTGEPIDYALEWQKEIDSGLRDGPRIITSGRLLYASPLLEAEKLVRQNMEMGFDFLKVYSYLSREDFATVLDCAEELDFYASGHVPYAIGLDQALSAGMDEIAHVEELIYEFFSLDRNQDLTPSEWQEYIIETAMLQVDIDSETLVEGFKEKNETKLDQISNQLHAAHVPVCTTMVLDESIYLKLIKADEFLQRPENKYFEHGYLELFMEGREKHQIQCKGIEGLCQFKYEIDKWILQSLHQNGVVLLLGTDSGTGGMGIIPGFSIHDELQILIKNGFSAYEALSTGTVNAAQVVKDMGREGNFGTIEVGNIADMILVKENPLENISTIRAPLGVMAAGRWYSIADLNKMIEIRK